MQDWLASRRSVLARPELLILLPEVVEGILTDLSDGLIADSDGNIAHNNPIRSIDLIAFYKQELFSQEVCVNCAVSYQGKGVTNLLWLDLG